MKRIGSVFVLLVLSGLLFSGCATKPVDNYYTLDHPSPAAFEGAADIAVGNVVGSNVANVLLVLGVPALIMATPSMTSTITERPRRPGIERCERSGRRR